MLKLYILGDHWGLHTPGTTNCTPSTNADSKWLSFSISTEAAYNTMHGTDAHWFCSWGRSQNTTPGKGPFMSLFNSVKPEFCDISDFLRFSVKHCYSGKKNHNSTLSVFNMRHPRNPTRRHKVLFAGSSAWEDRAHNSQQGA